ncbi:MAG TPA: hypothetical protein VJ717_19865 [Gemmatimonadaceae bacterium]|nr:hypothetical protein [Gemmatimonadaceae bacterium]
MIAGRDASQILRLWEHGVARTQAVRALLLLSAAAPEEPAEQLVQLSVGHRNALLLSLRERLFGPTLDCLTRCPECDGSIHLTFAVADVRTAHPERCATFRVSVAAYDVHFRLPNTSDLIALENGLGGGEGEGESQLVVAERQLLKRCVLQVTAPEGPVSAEDLPQSVTTAIARRMGEVDPQAELLLDIACPSCGVRTHAPFDIAAYLWSEIEGWAKGMLRSIHTIAAAYGWGESDIVALHDTRRRAYLELILA